MNGTRQQQSDCARITKGRPPEVPPRLREEPLRQSDSQTTESRPGRRPRLCCHPPSTHVVTPPKKLSSPSFRYRRFFSTLEAIDERRRYSRALFGRKAKDVFKEVIYTSVHARKSSRCRPAATPNPSTGTSPGVKVRDLLSAERYFFLPQLGVLIEGATVEGQTAHLQAGLFRSG